MAMHCVHCPRPAYIFSNGKSAQTCAFHLDQTVWNGRFKRNPLTAGPKPKISDYTDGCRKLENLKNRRGKKIIF